MILCRVHKKKTWRHLNFFQYECYLNVRTPRVRTDDNRTLLILPPLLKKTRYIFLKNDENLTQKQREKKQELQLSELNLKSMEALRMRETFIHLLDNWLSWVVNCDLEPMKKSALTVQAHLTGIKNWITSKINHGILEGLNSVVQAAKRKARGYGRQHFHTMTFLLTRKLNYRMCLLSNTKAIFIFKGFF